MKSYQVADKEYTVSRDGDTVTLSVNGDPVRELKLKDTPTAIECEHWVRYTPIEVRDTLWKAGLSK